MSEDVVKFPPTIYATELLEQGYSIEEVQKILKEEHVSFSNFAGVFNELMGLKGLTVDIIAGRAEIDPATIYRFMKEQRNPSRNALLRIALSMELTMEETQRLLKSGNCSTLSITRERDWLIMDAVIHKKDFTQVNELLTTKGHPDLSGRS